MDILEIRTTFCQSLCGGSYIDHVELANEVKRKYACDPAHDDVRLVKWG